jgi:hypothetical protein
MFLINPYILQASGGVIPTANLFAYSFRKVVSSATVSFRVRRSSDNAEQDIGFVGDDLDTTSLTSFVGANNGFVTKMYEQGGSGKDLTQTTASSQFQIVDAGAVYLLNGKPTCVTNSGDYLLTNTNLFNFVNTVGASVFSVTQPISQIGGSFSVDFLYSIGDSGSGSSDRVIDLQISGSTGSPTDYRSNLQAGTSTITQAYTSGTKLNSNVFKTGEHKFYQNNSLIGTNTPTLVDIINNRLVLNSSSWSPGSTISANQYFSEILLYNSYEDSNVNSINTNINNYYGIY